jgi:two-component system OmpR family response regulator
MDAVKTPILLIDDDELIVEALTEYLAKFDFALDVCHHPEQGLDILNQHKHELLLLDVMLPGISGLEVCKQLRKTSDIPIIMLTARRELSDKVLGFEYGADDYLAKPFEPRELIARMQRLLRRQVKLAESLVEIDQNAFRIDKEKRQVVIDNNPIDLTSIEFDILFLLSNEPGAVFDRNKILQYVKGLNKDVMLQTRAIDNSISRLRRKLNDQCGSQQLIRTVWGQGYSFAFENVR